MLLLGLLKIILRRGHLLFEGHLMLFLLLSHTLQLLFNLLILLGYLFFLAVDFRFLIGVLFL